MTKTPNPPAPPVDRTPAPADVPRVTYTTIEGITTTVNAPVAPTPTQPTEENE